MSKAEDRAKERYWLEPSNIETQEKYAAYVEGYHQAEKDLELTWEDLMAIDDLLDELLPPRRDSDELVLKGYYQEVLKRFKERKEKSC